MDDDAKLFTNGGVRIMFGGKPVGFAKEGMLTYNNEDEETTKDSGAYYSKPHSFEITGEAVVTNLADSIRELLNDTPRKVDVEILREMPNVMPRKMKKAYRMRNRYQRDTKWKRKAKAYARHFIYRLPDAEMVVTREQMGTLEATIKGSSLQYNPDAYVSGKDIAKAMAAYVRRR
jgi:hypothetical protein